METRIPTTIRKRTQDKETKMKMTGKVIAYDCETSGLDSEVCGLTQLSGIIYIDGVQVDEFNFDIRPFTGAEIQKKALEVTGKTFDEVMNYPEEGEVFQEFISLLKKHIDPMVYLDSLTPIAYNGNFDSLFMQAWFERQGKKFGNYLNYRLVDPLALLRIMHLEGLSNLPSYTLSNTYKALFDEDFEAHDSQADVKAMMRIYAHLVDNYLIGKPL